MPRKPKLSPEQAATDAELAAYDPGREQTLYCCIKCSCIGSKPWRDSHEPECNGDPNPKNMRVTPAGRPESKYKPSLEWAETIPITKWVDTTAEEAAGLDSPQVREMAAQLFTRWVPRGHQPHELETLVRDAYELARWFYSR